MTTRETVASSGVTVPSHAPRTLVIVAGRRSWLADWRELLAFRELLWVLTARDVTVRYKQTVLGTAWAVLRPLTAMIIFSVTFGRLAKLPSDGLPYPLFVYAGLLPWTFFSTAVANSGQSLVGSTALVSKIYFPRVIIPLSSIGASLVDMLISMVILVLMMLWYGVGMHANLLAIPIALGAAAITAVSFGILLAA